MKNVTTINAHFVESVHADKETTLVSEIRIIKAQAEQLMLTSSIELGRRLTEAKAMVKHGQWESWLKERVDFTPRTARSLMAIYKEYGEAAKRKSISVLNYTQALELLALPADTREEFVEKNDMKDMTIKELKAQIKAINEEKTSADNALRGLKEAHEKLQKDNTDKEKELAALSSNIAALQKQQKEAAEKQDKTLSEHLEKSIQSEREKIGVLEKEKAELSEQIAAIEKAKTDAIEKARKQEQEKAQKMLDKKAKELESATNRFNSELEKVKKENRAALDKAKEQTKSEQQKARDAENRANLSKDIVRCEYLLTDIQGSFETLRNILNKMQSSYPDSVKEIESALGDVLKAMEKRAKLHIAS